MIVFMTKNTLPPSMRQVMLLALILITPLALVIAAMSHSGVNTAEFVLGALIAGFLVLLYFVVTRHAVEISPERLTVRHSIYTVAIERSAISAAKVQQVRTAGCLGLAVRTNGIAAFGYLSGWFRTGDSRRAFCAVSQNPLYLVTFEGNPDCRQLALSADADVARQIEAWAAAK